MIETDQNIVLLLQKIASQLSPNDDSKGEDIRRTLMEKINLRNIDLHTALKDFILAQESLDFIASDYQLRLKAADIWKSQKNLFVEVLKSRVQDLEDIALRENIDIKSELNRITELN